jgi:RNA polymerase sigma-70 factor (ECF subfamily)
MVEMAFGGGVGLYEQVLPGTFSSYEASKVKNVDDADIIASVRGGNTAAFSELVLKYQDRLLNAVTYISGSRDAAEDVVQDAFVQAYTKLHSFGGNSAFYTWLYRIAINAAISRRRKRKGETSIDARHDERGVEPSDNLEGAEDRVLREERAGQVQAALAALSAEHRMILVLREMEDCDYDQIAEILDVPVGTVRSRLHRARLQMREQLEIVFREHASD